MGYSHAALQICDRIVEVLQGHSTIEPTKVGFSKAYELEEEMLPFIDVTMGVDQPLNLDEQTNLHNDSLLQVDIDIYTQDQNDTALREAVNLRALIHNLIMSEWTLSLPFVIKTDYGGAQAPALDDEGGLPGWYLTTTWLVHYRTNINDPTTYDESASYDFHS